MSYLTVFLLFVAKHFFLANIVDIGYSESRRERHTLSQAWLYLTYQVLLEAVVSLFMMSFIGAFDSSPFQMWRWETFLGIEVLGGIVTWLLERNANYDNAISTHVIAELGLLFLYAFIVYACYPF